MTSKPKHTPGKWIIESANFNRRQYYAICSSPAPLNPSPDEVAANAALIAAAPEMLKACKDALVLIGPPTGETCPVSILAEILTSAIAKAEGRP